MTEQQTTVNGYTLKDLLPFVMAVASGLGSYIAVRTDLADLRATVVANSKLDDIDRAAVQMLTAEMRSCKAPK